MIGRQLKHYVIGELLGKGGMGAVYKAMDSRLQRRVALKVLPEEVTGDPERRRRFLREARGCGDQPSLGRSGPPPGEGS